MGEVRYFLGMQVTMVRDDAGVLTSVKLTNEKVITELLESFGYADSKPKATPLDVSWRLAPDEGEPLAEGNRYRELLGKVLYLANTVRPDISFVAGVLSRFAANPTTHHWRAGLGVLRYLVGTKGLGLQWDRAANGDVMVGFVDSDFAGDCASRKSTSGGVFLAGTAAVSWISKLQPLAALSTVEAEYISMCSGVQEALWLEKLVSDFNGQSGALVLYSDNTGALVNVRGNPSSQRTKHIGVRYQRIRDEVQQGRVDPQYVPSEENAADLFTKALPKGPFLKLRDMLGLKP
jgi:histone deacetylase 1/2